MRICSGRNISWTFPWAGGPIPRDTAQRACGRITLSPGVQNDCLPQELCSGTVRGTSIDDERVANLGQLSVPHDGHLVREGQRLGLVVCNQDGGHPFVVENLGYRSPRRDPKAGVEGLRRLPSSSMIGLAGQCPGQSNPLLLTGPTTGVACALPWTHPAKP